MTDKHLQISVRSSWTDEKHLQFLRSVEASFVRTMRHGNDGNRLLCLDRYIPDISESTRDSLKSKRKKRLHPTDLKDLPARTSNGGADKKPRRLSSEPSDSSHDQVVPQLTLNKAADYNGN